MKNLKQNRAVTALVACVALGAAGGIAGALAAPGKKSSTRAAPAAPARDGHGRGFGGPPHGPAVHAEEVVLNKAGTAFITETDDRGKVKSVSGNDVTITEGVGNVTYKDVTVTVPDSATVVRNGNTAKLSDLVAGDHVDVSSSSDGTRVFAADASFRPARGPGHGRGPGPGPDGHGGPPPGMPGA